ncbi:MAG: hypothetical protein ACWA5R_00465 [bacterium]
MQKLLFLKKHLSHSASDNHAEEMPEKNQQQDNSQATLDKW